VPQLDIAELRVHRHHRRAGRQRTHDRDARLQARLGPHADALRAGDPARYGAGSVA
jgi:hypothetical protein